MKQFRKLLTVLFAFILTLSIAGCSAKSGNSLAGKWEYRDEDMGIVTTYDLKEDGTGTCTMDVAGNKAESALTYEAKNSHLTVTFESSEAFDSEGSDFEFTLKDDQTLILKDASGQESEYIRQ